jgi:hypothetical protein
MLSEVNSNSLYSKSKEPGEWKLLWVSGDHLNVDEGVLGDEIDRAILDLDAQIVLIELLDPPLQHRAIEQVELQQALVTPQVSEKVGLFGFGRLGLLHLHHHLVG